MQFLKTPYKYIKSTNYCQQQNVHLKIAHFLKQRVNKEQNQAYQKSNTTHVFKKLESPQFDLKTYLSQNRRIIDGALDQSLPTEGKPQILVDAMRYQLLNGGKRMCPIVCIAACELVGGSVEQVLGVACAHEMIHAMSLAHDDLPAMDNDEFRRGQPSCWRKFGEDITILAGDALIAYAFEYIARSSGNVDAQKILQVIVELGQCIGAKGVAGGQAADTQNRCSTSSAHLKTLEYIHTHKTAKLLESAAVCGVIIANGTQQHITAMRTYAINIGLAYQIIDDVLDVTQTREQLGKSVGKDVDQGKITYPKLIGLEQSRRVAEELIQHAKQQILTNYQSEKAIPLLHLADYVLERAS